MFSARTTFFAALCVVSVVRPTIVCAQTVATSFEQLRFNIKAGDTLRVRDASGQEMTGKLVDLSQQSLALAVHGVRRDLSELEVVQISRGGRHLKAGILWGLGVGAGIGLAADVDCIKSSCFGPQPPDATLFYSGVGVAIGAGIGAAINTRRILYSRPISH
jgi:hypothetical protein